MEAPFAIAAYPFEPRFRRQTSYGLRIGNVIASGCVIACMLGMLLFVIIWMTDTFTGPGPASPILKAIGTWIMVGAVLVIIALILAGPNIRDFEAGLKQQYEDEVTSWRSQNSSRQWRVERPSWDAGGNLMVDLIHINSIMRIDGVHISGSRYRISLVLAAAGTTETTLRFTDVWYQRHTENNKQYRAQICFGGAVIITTPDLEAFQFSPAMVAANGLCDNAGSGPDGAEPFTEYHKPYPAITTVREPRAPGPSRQPSRGVTFVSPIKPYLTYEFTPVGDPSLQRKMRWLMLTCLALCLLLLVSTSILIVAGMDGLHIRGVPQKWVIPLAATLAAVFLAGCIYLLMYSERTRTQLAAVIDSQIEAELARWLRSGPDRWTVQRMVWIADDLNLWLLNPDGTPLESRLRIENARDDFIVSPDTTANHWPTIRFARIWHVRYGDTLEWMWRPRPVRICFLGPLILYRPGPPTESI
jgi:hypothetical protein